ncbi:MAG: hypothetical protein RML45_07690 [Acetobacteraceae bacterium]|nr:hypothetical protein [Acetobacteraceae bacterium]
MVVLALFVLWEGVVLTARLPSFVLPAPTEVFATLVQFAGPIAQHSLHTLMTTLVGFGFSVVGGVALGAAIGASQVAYKAVFPVLVGFNSIPKVAIVPGPDHLVRDRHGACRHHRLPDQFLPHRRQRRNRDRHT